MSQLGHTVISFNDFLSASREFVLISNRINDDWKFMEHPEVHKSYIKKETFLSQEDKTRTVLYKAEYIIFYNLSYGVPAFSFNVWNSSGSLLSLEDIRKMAMMNISEKEFYTVVTQQEHPILGRPYFIMHPCHTEVLLKEFKNKSKNIIVTFLSLITLLLKLNLSFEYGL